MEEQVEDSVRGGGEQQQIPKAGAQQQNRNAAMGGADSWCFKVEEARQRRKYGELVFAHDLSAKNGSKRFEPLAPGEAIRQLRANPGRAHVYEYLGVDEPQQFHVDVDLTKERGLEDKALAVLLEVRVAVSRAARKWGLDAGEPVLFNSSTADKGSFHAHFPSLFFANRAIKLEFAKAVQKELEVLTVAPGAESAQLAMAGAFDMNVYSSGQRAWRAPYACKMGKQNVKKLWRDGRRVELSELTDEYAARLFVRTQWRPDVAPITANPNGASESASESASSSEPPAKRRKTGATNGESKATRRDDNNTETLDKSTLENAVKAAVAYLDNRRPELSKAVKRQGSAKELDKCTVSVLFGPANRKAGYTCPLNASREQHKSNCFAVHVRDGGVCGIRCHGCKLYVKVVDPPQTVDPSPVEDADAAANEVNAAADDEIFLKFGGKPVDPRAPLYHTLELGEQMAALIVGALNTTPKTNLTIFNESSKGAGKTTALMHVIQRVLQVHPRTTVLMATSRNALGSQLARDAREYTEVKLRPRAPDQSGQDLECIQEGGAEPPPQLPPLPSCFPAVHLAQHTDHDDQDRLLDLADRRAHPIVSCSVESIGRGRLSRERRVEKFHIVVVDEITAHLKQHTSTDTMDDKQRLEAWDTTSTLCNEATVRIVMCADLTDATRKFCMDRLSPRGAATYKCRVVGGGFTTHVTSAQAVKDKICDVLVNQPHNNAWVASNSLRQSKHVRDLIQRRAVECDDLDLANGVQLFCGSDGNGLSREERTYVLEERDFSMHLPAEIYVRRQDRVFEKVPNDEGQRFPIRAFIYTPAITHGFSVQQRETHFTHVFGVFTGKSGAPARDAAQQMVRLRGASACMVGISGGKEQDLDEKEIRDRSEDLFTSVTPHAPCSSLRDWPRRVVQPHWLLIKPDRGTALGKLRTIFTEEEERSKVNYTLEFIRATRTNPHNTVYVSENAPRGSDANRQKLCALRVCIDDALAASKISDVNKCQLYGERGLYDIPIRARKVYDDKSCLNDQWRLAASEVAHAVAADVKKRILDPPAKRELFYKFLQVLGYNTEQDVLDLVQLSAPPRIPEPLPELFTYVQIARDLVFPRDAVKRTKLLNLKEQPTRNDWNKLWTSFIGTSDFDRVALRSSGRSQANGQRLFYSRKLDGGLLSLVQAHLSRQGPATQPASEANAKAFIEAKLKELTELASKESKRPASAPKKRALEADDAVRVESQMYQRVLRNDGFDGDYRVIAPPIAEVPLNVRPTKPSSSRPGLRHVKMRQLILAAMTDPSFRDYRRGVMLSCDHRKLALLRHVKMRQLIRAMRNDMTTC